MKKSIAFTTLLLILSVVSLQAEKRRIDLEERSYHPGQNTQLPKLKSAEAIFTDKLDSMIRYDYDVDYMDYTISYKEYYEYDSLGRCDQRTSLYPEDTGIQQIDMKVVEFSYDQDGRLVEALWLDNYSYDTNTLVPGGKENYTYNVNGDITEIINYNWDENLWDLILSSKREYSYNVNGDITLYQSSNWNENDQDYRPNTRYVTSYDLKGNKTEYLQATYDTTSQTWRPSENKYTWAYNAEDHLQTSAKILKYGASSFLNDLPIL